MFDIQNQSDLKNAIQFADRNAGKATDEIEKLSLLCITRAQEYKDVDLEFMARMAYLNVANYRHKPSEMIAMFPWIVKKCDEDPERFPYNEMLWAYKWVMCVAKQYATIPKSKLETLWEDFERKMHDSSFQPRAIHEKKMYYYSETGNIDLAEEQLKLHATASNSGKIKSCPRCQPLGLACYLFDRGRYEQLLELINPVMTGEITCHSTPRYHLHMAMISLMHLGRWEEAEKYAMRSRKELDLNIAILFPFSSHLIYHGITEQFAKGRNIFEKQLPYTFQNAPDLPKLEFFTAALVFFTRLQRSGRKKVKLNLAENKLLYDPTSIYGVDSVVDVLREEVHRIASALDDRNENDHYKNFVETLRLRYENLQKPS